MARKLSSENDIDIANIVHLYGIEFFRTVRCGHHVYDLVIPGISQFHDIQIIRGQHMLPFFRAYNCEQI